MKNLCIYILHIFLFQLFVFPNERAFVDSQSQGNCGVLTKKPKDVRERAPWVAAIFQKNPSSGNWDYLCGATVTSHITVITTANCVQSIIKRGVNPQRVHLRYSTLRIVAGLRSANYSDRDAHTQEREVAQIREHRVPNDINQGQIYYQQANLAGIRLLQPFNLTSFVTPVCLVEVPNSVQELLTTAPGEVVTLAGYGVQTQPAGLKITKLKLTTALECTRKYSHTYLNVVCGEATPSNMSRSTTLTEQIIPCDLEGHGMIVRTDGVIKGKGLFYLMGVYTANSARIKDAPDFPVYNKRGRKCAANDVVFFTKYGEHYRWAISHFFAEPDLLMCHSDYSRPLEDLCDGKANCADGSDETIEICYAQKDCTEDQLRCDYGACVNKTLECDGNWDCADGTDEKDEKKCRELDKARNVTCPIPPPRRDLARTCALPEHLKGHEIDCGGRDSPLVVGTTMTVRCAPYYVPHVQTATILGVNDAAMADGGPDDDDDDADAADVDDLEADDDAPDDDAPDEDAPDEDADVDNGPISGETEHMGKDSFSKGHEGSRFGNQLTVECLRNGTWSQEIGLKCAPDCGVSRPPNQAHIVGGKTVQKEERTSFPWSVAIYLGPETNKTGDVEFQCGGTLVAPNVVLTAAHCVTAWKEPFNPTRFRVFFAKPTSILNDTDEHTQTIPVKRIQVGATYNPESYTSDIALMILERPVDITHFVRPACLPLPGDTDKTEELLERANPINGSVMGTVLGFGIDEENRISIPLKKLDAPVVSHQVCKAFLDEKLGGDWYGSETWICAGHPNKRSAVCPGDSGGGFVLPYKTYGATQYFVHGIVSNGPDSDDPRNRCGAFTYKLFTKVQVFSGWIHKILHENPPKWPESTPTNHA